MADIEGQVLITMSDDTGAVVKQNIGSGTITLESTDLSLGSTRALKYVDFVKLEFTEEVDIEQLEIFIGGRDDLKEPVVYEGPFSGDEAFEAINLRKTYRFWRVMLSAESPSIFFLLGGIEFWGEPSGERIGS